MLADDGFAEHGGGDRNPGLFCQLEDLVLQAEAMDFYTGDNDRPLGLGQ